MKFTNFFTSFLRSDEGARKKQRGFTIIEVGVVMVIMAVGVVLIARNADTFQGRSRVADAAQQLAAVQGAMNDWAPRSGIYTIVPTTQELIDDGFLSTPVDAAGNSKPATEMNPWDGEVSVETGPTNTSYTVTFSGITRGGETRQLARRLTSVGEVTSDDESEVTVVVGDIATN